MDQFKLKGVTVSALGPALVLSMFSFVGFESATTLGGEAREPLKTIPRAVMQCAILAGVFFMLCSYSEVLGFRGESSQLSDSTSPLHLLANKAGISPLGIAIDFGAAVSMFACVLACTTAAARVLMKMAHGKLLPTALERTSRRHGTPGTAIALSAGLMFAATAALALRGVQGSDMYDWLGSLSVFGFLTAYALVAVALPFARRALGQHSHWVAAVSVVTVVVMILIVPLRPALGNRRNPCAHSVDLPGLHRRRAGLVFPAPRQDRAPFPPDTWRALAARPIDGPASRGRQRPRKAFANPASPFSFNAADGKTSFCTKSDQGWAKRIKTL
jgi:amino acid transporter